MSDLHALIIRYIESGTSVTRKDIYKARLGYRDEVRTALADLNSKKLIWLIGDGTIEVAGKTAKL